MASKMKEKDYLELDIVENVWKDFFFDKLLQKLNKFFLTYLGVFKKVRNIFLIEMTYHRVVSGIHRGPPHRGH